MGRIGRGQQSKKVLHVLEAQSQAPAGPRRHGVTRAKQPHQSPISTSTDPHINFIPAGGGVNPHRRCYEVPWVCAALGRDAVFWSCCAGLYLFRGLGGGGEGDGVAELFELSDEEPSASFGLIAACEVIGAEFFECCFVVDEVPADHQDRVRDRD
jgi:hypothetical protein